MQRSVPPPPVRGANAKTNSRHALHTRTLLPAAISYYIRHGRVFPPGTAGVKVSLYTNTHFYKPCVHDIEWFAVRNNIIIYT